ncbi:ATP-dependent DNA helicase [Corynebacterium lizhenjunii]|uniref:ATP-dependent DNA helicase n=1 Tax=Corynebacterium lizhenjunii TaxID=2709394 RepID=UPI0013EC4495|nr:ATP-dependent DNA helicase [Corynebacterium lizhenjunii]
MSPSARSGPYDPHAAVRSGVILPPTPQVRLVAPQALEQPRQWEQDLPRTGRWVVTGAAGSGVSSFLVDTVLEKLRSGADPSGILVVAASKESGAQLRRELSGRLDDYAAQTTMVRSVHSLAFSLVRAHVDEGLRLITGAEQDVVIRQLLAAHADAGGAYWPEPVRPALELVGFARQLRDFLLRAGERGLGPEDLESLGARHRQPMWEAAGQFMREYEQVMSLSGRRSLSAAEIVSVVGDHPEMTQNSPWHTVVVDDAQLLDPNAGELIARLSQTAELTIIGGDPDQAVFAFRGANSRFLTSFAEQLPGVQTVELTTPRRTPAPACVSIVDSARTAQDVVADSVRRRHLEDGVPWSQIAVVVRGGGDISAARRALLAAGVPVHIQPTDVVLGEQRLVASLLQAIHALYHELSTAELEELITGPIGGADPVTLRRLIRGLRRWQPQQRGMDTLREVLDGPLPDFGTLLTGRELAILERVRTVLDAGRAVRDGSVEEVLWAVWSATGLAERLQAAALRGGATGSQADRDLDAVMALFDAAGDFAERYPQLPMEAFIEEVLSQDLPTGVRDRRVVAPEAVEIISAHGAVGREWDTVILTGAQEGSWPSLGETGSLFGQEDLIDLLDRGIDPDTHVSHLSDRLAEERRLFHVATTRHRNRLHIVAVDAPQAEEVYEPSRFIAEFCGRGVDLPATLARREADAALRRSAWARELGLDVPAVISAQRLNNEGELDPLQVSVLSVPAFVAQLRRVVSDVSADGVQREQAARQLARLAQAGVPGAHPAQWWALTVSTGGEAGAEASAESADVPVADPAEPGTVRLPSVSPSKVEKLLKCPLQAVLGDIDSEEATPLAAVRGTVAHAFLEALGRGVDPELAEELSRHTMKELLDVPAWKRDYELSQWDNLVERTRQWVAATRGVYELVGVEVPVDVTVAPGVKVFGYIDRLERERGSENGALVVVDLKTGASVPSAQSVQENPQMAAYQLAVRGGKLRVGADSARVITAPAGQTGEEFGSAVMVYPAADRQGIAQGEQAPWPEDELAEFAGQLPGLVHELQAAHITARENPDCQRCRISTVCPVRPEGRMTTDVS